MTATTGTGLPEMLRREAAELVRDLAAAAGDEARVLDVLEDYAPRDGIATALRTASAALVLTFGSCLTPIQLDQITNTEE